MEQGNTFIGLDDTRVKGKLKCLKTAEGKRFEELPGEIMTLCGNTAEVASAIINAASDNPNYQVENFINMVYDIDSKA